MTKWVYEFAEGNANMRELLGGKGANLAEMTNLGLPIPHGLYGDDRGVHGLLESVASTISEEIQRSDFRRAWQSWTLEEVDEGKKFWRSRRIRCWFPSARARALPCRA